VQLNILLTPGILLIEIVSLYFFAKLLTNSLARIFYHFTHSHERTVHLLALVFLPGTLIHELSHILMAGVLLVPTGSFDVIPKILEGGRVRLGSAQVGECDPFRRALIGVAPVILGLGLIWAVLHFLAFNTWAMTAVSFYLSFIIANTMFSSPKDLEGTVEVAVMIVSLMAALYFVGLLSLDQLIQPLSIPSVQSGLRSFIILLGVPITIDLVLYLLSRLLLNKLRS
jgi:hypothetical protein